MPTCKTHTEPLGSQSITPEEAVNAASLQDARNLAEAVLEDPSSVAHLANLLGELGDALPDLLRDGADSLSESAGVLEDLAATIPAEPLTLEDKVNRLLTGTALLLAAVADLLDLVRRQARRARRAQTGGQA